MKRELMKYAPKGIAIFLSALILTGLTLVPGYNIKLLPIAVWPTLFPWSSVYYDSTGIPLISASNPNYYLNTTPDNTTLLNYVLATLPERTNQSASLSLFPELSSTPIGAIDYKRYNVYLDRGADVEISFIYENAGYRNSLGYFTFDPANPPTKTTPSDLSKNVMIDGIIFPNASLFNSGGNVNGLYTGNTAKISFDAARLTTYPWNAGKDCTVAGNCKLGIGFTLIADGFQWSSTNGGVRPSPNPNWVFYSISGMNPEVNTSANPDIQQHMVMLNVPGSSLYALAFEDMSRTSGSGCDHDFNDVVYRLNVNPIVAFTNRDSVYHETVPDFDKDGVPDAMDEFPNDNQRATSVWYPSKTGWNTLGFEDSWPNAGDYDMNDLVVNYRHRQILRADGLVKEVEIYYQLAAAGAKFHNGFAVELTGLPKGTTPLDYARIKIGSGGAVAITPQTASNLAFTIFNDSIVELGTDMVNTVKGGNSSAVKTYQLNVAFTNPMAKTAFTYPPPYNPFLFRTGSSPAIEVHLPGHTPTSIADISSFGKGDDNSDQTAKRYYVTKANSATPLPAGLPWAIDIPLSWNWPVETKLIVQAYPDFVTWVNSGGAQKTSWYSNPASSLYVYR